MNPVNSGYHAIQQMSFDGYTQQQPSEFDFNACQLPPPNMSCYIPPIIPQGETKYFRIEEPCEKRTIVQNFSSVTETSRENTNHYQHVKNVVIHVNRNHWHTQRVVVKDNNYHHYLINNIIRVHDIHHQKVENVPTPGITVKDFKQSCRVEPAQCRVEGQEQPQIQHHPTQTHSYSPSPNYIQNTDMGFIDCPEQKQQIQHHQHQQQQQYYLR